LVTRRRGGPPAYRPSGRGPGCGFASDRAIPPPSQAGVGFGLGSVSHSWFWPEPKPRQIKLRRKQGPTAGGVPRRAWRCSMAGFSLFHTGRPAWGNWLIPRGGGLFFSLAETPNALAKPQKEADKPLPSTARSMMAGWVFVFLVLTGACQFGHGLGGFATNFIHSKSGQTRGFPRVFCLFCGAKLANTIPVRRLSTALK